MNIVIAFIIHAIIVVVGIVATGLIISSAITRAANKIDDKSH